VNISLSSHVYRRRRERGEAWDKSQRTGHKISK
jgi:hypothetical protein